ncbi:unnamed protein product [Darwinula stevensoni]|uniref:U3 small nucleolar RNA-associated protein 14 n=1 Tax=Darwinula stevensoni TaxID=69355 RepID=A0A7R8X8Y1_9CRUS|nr:unnamed protein product [Darwinula stevensoni]CAG0889135.1 unnamed protein product [Darwinula stevensoni]
MEHLFEEEEETDEEEDKMDMAELDEDSQVNDDDGDDAKHVQLLKAITKMDNFKCPGDANVSSNDTCRKGGTVCTPLEPMRREPSTQVSEYELSKSNASEVKVEDLLAPLKGKTRLQKLLGSVQKTEIRCQKATLDVPLPKPQALRVEREVGYQKTSEEVGKWDDVVRRNRLSRQISFPLNDTQLQLLTSEEYISKFKKPSTRLEERVYTLLEGSPHVIHPNVELTQYHRILKRERLRTQLKQFEELKRKDPGAALEQLRELEQQRALERVTLRHRVTSRRSKFQAIRAKYDPEARKVLAEQLLLSKELRKKVHGDSESEEEGEVEGTKKAPLNLDLDPNNPWMATNSKGKDPPGEAHQEDGGYRKFWLTIEDLKYKRANPITNLEKEQAEKESIVEVVESSTPKEVEKTGERGRFDFTSDRESAAGVEKDSELGVQVSKVCAQEDTVEQHQPSPKKKEHKMENQRTKRQTQGNVNKERDVDDMFDAVEEELEKRAQKKLCQLRLVGGRGAQKKLRQLRKATGFLPEALRRQKKRVKCKGKTKSSQDWLVEEVNPRKEDLGLNEGTTRSCTLEQLDHVAMQEKEKPEMNQRREPGGETSGCEKVEDGQDLGQPREVNVDPGKYMQLRAVKIQGALPNALVLDEDRDENAFPEDVIAEAFEEDDVIEKFRVEKQAAMELDELKDMVLTLPGWGEWGGPNPDDLDFHKRPKKRRFIKAPEPPPRKDRNLGNVIISEKKNQMLRQHQVSEVPFPFLTVRDFEASIRTPLGKTWVPETAHRLLTAPPVMTRMGAVIEPMDSEALLNLRQRRELRKQANPQVTSHLSGDFPSKR